MLTKANNIYEVSPMTMAILPKENDTGKMVAVVLEESREYNMDHPPTKIIDNACKFFGSSLRGRLEGTKDVSNFTHKAPIVIDPSSGMYFFPTTSPTSNKCSWISHSHIDFIKPVGNDYSEVIFKNGKSIVVDISYGSLRNQIQRTAQFRFLLDNRIKRVKAPTEPESFRVE